MHRLSKRRLWHSLLLLPVLPSEEACDALLSSWKLLMTATSREPPSRVRRVGVCLLPCAKRSSNKQGYRAGEVKRARVRALRHARLRCED